MDDEYGAWSKAGCSLIKDGQDSTSCRCNHLTNFAILVDSQGLQQDQNVGIAIDQNIGIAMIVGPLVLLVCAIFTFVCLIITRLVLSMDMVIYLISITILFLQWISLQSNWNLPWKPLCFGFFPLCGLPSCIVCGRLYCFLHSGGVSFPLLCAGGKSCSANNGILHGIFSFGWKETHHLTYRQHYQQLG